MNPGPTFNGQSHLFGSFPIQEPWHEPTKTLVIVASGTPFGNPTVPTYPTSDSHLERRSLVGLLLQAQGQVAKELAARSEDPQAQIAEGVALRIPHLDVQQPHAGSCTSQWAGYV